ncbi:MAG: FKBP-type peptidyl-prolyl cis-trans isomerase [Chlamydiia bacterium]|nr:FKBP-type peptidyl-prolyl cis-trans isomerase [Chlamydiia bacterium]
MGNKVRHGDRIRLHLTFTTDEGLEYSTHGEGAEPIDCFLGRGVLLEVIEKALIGMEIGSTKELRVPKDQGVPHRDDLIVVLDYDLFDQVPEVDIGQTLILPQNNGPTLIVKVLEKQETGFKVDANPPIAAQDFTAKIEVIEVVTPAFDFEQPKE